MTPVAGPSNKRSTHDIVLTQGSNVVGLRFCDVRGKLDHTAFRKRTMRRTSLQIYEGSASHDDLELPWRSIIQDDWSNGFNNKYLDNDGSAYAYGVGMDTCNPGQLIAAGMPCYTLGYRNLQFNWPRDADRWAFAISTPGTPYFAKSFVASGTYTMRRVYLMLRKVGSPPGNVTIQIWSDSGGSPNVALATVTYDATALLPYFTEIRTELTLNLTSGTTYWLVISYGGDASNYVEAMASQDASGAKSGTAGPVWSVSTYGLFWRGYESWLPTTFWFAEYKGSVYAIADYDATTTPRVFVNGYQGTATGGSTSTLADTIPTWVADEWIGSIVQFMGGAGSAQRVNYAYITDSAGGAGAGSLSFQTVDVAVAAGTEYVIVASDKWTELTGHGLSSGPITDVLSANGALYICQGDGINVRRMRRYTSGGAWTTQWADEGYAATLMIAGSDGTGNCLWKANRGYPATFQRAPAVDCTGAAAAAALTFAAVVNVGSGQERNTGLELYQGTLYILKEASIWYLNSSGLPLLVDIREMANTRDSRNGAAHLVQGLNLWSSWHNGLERYSAFNDIIDGMGAEKADHGVENIHHASYKHLSGYPGKIIGVHGGEYGGDFVMAHNGAGRDGVGWNIWMENSEWDLQGAGDVQRILNEKSRRTFIQSIPGDGVDRLWVSRGADIVWMPIDTNPWPGAAPTLPPYVFGHTGYLETSWLEAKFSDVDKLWKSIALVVDHGLVPGSQFEYMIQYKKDDDVSWTTLSTKITSLGRTEITLSSTYAVVGKRIKFRIHLFNKDYNFSPRITAVIVECLLRMPIRWSVSALVRLADGDYDLQGQLDGQDSDAKLALLETMASTPQPVLVTATSRRLNNKYMIVDPDGLDQIENVEEDNHSGESNTESNVYSIMLLEAA